MAKSTQTWRETVRDIFDLCHFDDENIFNGSPLAARIVGLIESRHTDYFCVGKAMKEKERDDGKAE